MGQTYKRGSSNNKLPAPKGEVHTIIEGDSYWDAPLTCYDIWFTRALYGNWVDPFHDWFGHENWTDDLLHEYESFREYRTLLDIKTAMSNPYEGLVKLKLKDTGTGQDPKVIESEMIFFAYAPITRPVEVSRSATYFVTVTDLVISKPYYAELDVDVKITWNRIDAEWDFFGQLGNVTDIVDAIIGNRLLTAICALVGLGAEEFGPREKTADAKFGWGSSPSIYAGIYTSPQPGMVPADYFMVPSREDGFAVVTYDCEQYDTHGYVGNVLDTGVHATGLGRLRRSFKHYTELPAYLSSAGNSGTGSGTTGN